MKSLNAYFTKTNQKTDMPNQISLCGKLEALVGNYFLAGAGIPENAVETLYYDPFLDFMDTVSLVNENIVAYITDHERVAFVLEVMLDKFKKDTKEYDLIYIPVHAFDSEELYVDNVKELPPFLEGICWIDDDFLNNEDIPFDYEMFETIDSGVKYVNPKHFSVSKLIDVLKDGKKLQDRGGNICQN